MKAILGLLAVAAAIGFAAPAEARTCSCAPHPRVQHASYDYGGHYRRPVVRHSSRRVIVRTVYVTRYVPIERRHHWRAGHDRDYEIAPYWRPHHRSYRLYRDYDYSRYERFERYERRGGDQFYGHHWRGDEDRFDDGRHHRWGGRGDGRFDGGRRHHGGRWD